jgi:hypothetical protein
MAITEEQLLIAIHESVLDTMKERMARLHRQRRALEEEIMTLDIDIKGKQAAISAARDVWLRRCI